MTAPPHQQRLAFRKIKAMSRYQGHVSTEALETVRVSELGRPEFEIYLYYLIVVYPCTGNLSGPGFYI